MTPFLLNVITVFASELIVSFFPCNYGQRNAHLARIVLIYIVSAVNVDDWLIEID